MNRRRVIHQKMVKQGRLPEPVRKPVHAVGCSYLDPEDMGCDCGAEPNMYPNDQKA